jgi:hypothetical protein
MLLGWRSVSGKGGGGVAAGVDAPPVTVTVAVLLGDTEVATPWLEWDKRTPRPINPAVRPMRSKFKKSHNRLRRVILIVKPEFSRAGAELSFDAPSSKSVVVVLTSGLGLLGTLIACGTVLVGGLPGSSPGSREGSAMMDFSTAIFYCVIDC